MRNRCSPPAEGLKSLTEPISVRTSASPVGEDLGNYKKHFDLLDFLVHVFKTKHCSQNFKYKLSGTKDILKIITRHLKLLTIGCLSLSHRLLP